MTTRITQIDGQTEALTTLRVEGSLRLVDAELLESTYLELRAKTSGQNRNRSRGHEFLDSESASILCRLKDRNVELIGLHYFVNNSFQAAEKRIRSQVHATYAFIKLKSYVPSARDSNRCYDVRRRSGTDQQREAGPGPERVGIETADALPLSLNEAIRLALENNNDIRTSRIDVEKAELNLTARRGAYDPQLFSETYFERSSTPVASFLSGNNSGSLEQKDFTGKIGLTGRTPQFGGSHGFDWSSTRFSSNNFFNALDRATSSCFSLTYTQPLVRGFPTDDSCRQIEIAKKNLTLTDVQFRQRATEVITRVEHAYWELVHALKNMQVQSEVLSGATTPIEAMPDWMQPLTDLNPVKHFAVLARGVMLKGVGLDVLYPNFIALFVFTAILVGVSAWRFRKQLN